MILNTCAFTSSSPIYSVAAPQAREKLRCLIGEIFDIICGVVLCVFVIYKKMVKWQCMQGLQVKNYANSSLYRKT